jgi:hypothetical protein
VGEQSKRYVVACVEFDDFHGVYIHTRTPVWSNNINPSPKRSRKFQLTIIPLLEKKKKKKRQIP